MSQPPRPPGSSSRPHMPSGYGIDASGIGGAVSWEEVSAQLSAARNYWVATTRPDGRPHVMPVWGLWLDASFYFSTDPTSRKGRNLAANPAVVVHLESGDEVVILEGHARRVTDPALVGRFADAYDVKYQFRPDPSNPDHGVYEVRLRRAFAWRERDFPTSATRWLLPPEDRPDRGTA